MCIVKGPVMQFMLCQNCAMQAQGESPLRHATA